MANKAQLAQYLLGTLSEAEREPLEERYFADDDAFEQLLIAEEEMIDAYVRGELSDKQGAQLEAVFLNSRRRRERLYFARDLANIISDTRRGQTEQQVKRLPQFSLQAYIRSQHAALRFAIAAAGLAIVVGFSWLLVERARMVEELRRMHNDHAELVTKIRELERQSSDKQKQIGDLLAQLQSELANPSRGETGHSSASSIITFVLSSGLSRGGRGKTLALPQNTSSILLRLNVEVGSYVDYSAVIETTTQREVWRSDSVTPPRRAAAEGAIVLPLLPTKILPSGDYVLFLSGKRTDGIFESMAEYSFRIVRE